MAEREGIEVDWLKGRRGGAVQRIESAEGEGKWGPNETEVVTMEENRKRKRVTNDEDEEEEEDDERDAEQERIEKEKHDENDMLELRLSLAVAIRVPSPRRSSPPAVSIVRLDPQVENCHNGYQQQRQPHLVADVRNQLPVKQQKTLAPAQEQDRVSSRANLAASLKHLVSQPPPGKAAKTVQKIFGGPSFINNVANRSPAHFGASPPVPHQLPSPQPPPLAFSSSARYHPFPQEGHEIVGRLGNGFAFGAESAAPCLGLAGQRTQFVSYSNPSNHILVPSKGLHQPSSQPGPPIPQLLSRSASQGSPLQGQVASLRTNRGNEFPSTPSTLARILGSITRQQQQRLPNMPVIGPQQYPSLQNQALNTTVAAGHPEHDHHPSANSCDPAGPGQNANTSAFPITAHSSVCWPTPAGHSAAEAAWLNSFEVVNVCDRKLKVSSELDSTSLYGLCRRWVRGDAPRKDQSLLGHSRPLPIPLPAVRAGNRSIKNAIRDKAVSRLPQEYGPVGQLEAESSEDMLQRLVERNKKFRNKCQVERAERMTRFMHRLELVLSEKAEKIGTTESEDQSLP